MKKLFADYSKPFDTKYIECDERLKEAINSNEIKQYVEIPLLKVGDFVVCCDFNDSIEPKSNRGENEDYKSYSWDFGKVVKITEVGVTRYAYYIFGQNAENGVYASGVRYATQEEIDKTVN